MSDNLAIKDDSISKCCGTCGCKEAVAVEPLVHPRVSELLSDKRFLFDICDSNGGPVNLIFPQIVHENYLSFKNIFAKYNISGDVVLTTKPNKSESVLKYLSQFQVPMDVSSHGALQKALSLGNLGRRINCSGPKNAEYLYLAMMHECTINIDSISELLLLISIKQKFNFTSKVQILIRLTNFANSELLLSQVNRTLGIDIQNVSEVLEVLQKFKNDLLLKGFSFHLTLPSLVERIEAFEKVLDLISKTRRLGFAPNTINIGGGFRVRYAKSKDQWDNFQTYLKASVLGQVKPVTWGNSGLGFYVQDTTLAGTGNFNDHYPDIVGADELDFFLSHKLKAFDNQTVWQLLNESMLNLEVEPGRALYDQAGTTCSKILFIKHTAQEENLIGLDINQSHLRSKEIKILTQPIFLSRVNRKIDNKGYFLLSNLCLPNDAIYPHKVFPGVQLGYGDLVIFTNTAPYLMDFVQSDMLHQPKAEKIAIIFSEKGNKYCKDENFQVTSALLI